MDMCWRWRQHNRFLNNRRPYPLMSHDGGKAGDSQCWQHTVIGVITAVTVVTIAAMAVLVCHGYLAVMSLRGSTASSTI